MSTKSGFSIGGMKTTLERQKQKVMAQFGQAEKTVDIALNQEVERFSHHHKVMKKINKDCRAYIKKLRALAVAHSTLQEDISSLYESGARLWDANLKVQSSLQEIENFRMGLETALEEDLLNPLSEYMGQFSSLEQRIDELERRRLDMDRHRTDVKKMSEKPPQNPTKLPQAQTKLRYAKQGYEELKVELMRDLPLLFNDRYAFMDCCFATLITAQASYYAAGNKYLGEATPYFSHVDRSAVHRHPKVITEETVAMKPVYGNMEIATTVPTTTQSQYNSVAPTQTAPYTTTTTTTYQVTTQPAGGAYSTAPAGGGFGAAPPHPAPPANYARQAQALYPFDAQSDLELSFAYGEVINIISMDGDWWQGESHGRRGLVPGNYLKLL
eukprot:TRINITY_DN23776_c0_g1_i1.p1 TRINITY_DN23776_c0_g1~~TRINITY_DN23776_c0_g1_i1.p1  ORF type:complete len:384 (-),score=84.65 TRINITY_DN23776_c0_g1_i1:30-1181(-)